MAMTSFAHVNGERLLKTRSMSILTMIQRQIHAGVVTLIDTLEIMEYTVRTTISLYHSTLQ